jgi:dolichyl-phosphate-mannose-protein mannosyltransferase
LNANENVHKTDSPLIPTDAPVPPPPAADGAQKPIVDQPREGISAAPEPLVSPPPEAPLAPGHSIVSREEKVEYRDQDGNILDAEQVKALEGKVSFKTRYETRTRMVDAAGNEINPEGVAPVAPPHPDVQGVDSSTIGKPDPDTQDKPNAQREVAADESKESGLPKTGEAKPASEGNEATGAGA